MIADALREFVTIVEQGSVSKAARALELPRATLSRHLAAMEDDLGVTLLRRQTRRLTLTAAGETLYRRALKLVADAQALEVAVRELDGVPRGVLRVSVPPAIGDRGGELLGRYLDKYAEVSIDVVSTARHVDLVGEGIDVALRGGVVRDPSLMVRQLMPSRIRLVAAPALLEATGPIESVEDLLRLPCVRMYEGGWRPIDHYPLTDGGAVQVDGRLRCNDVVLARSFVLEGRAAALLPDEFTVHDLERGAMVEVLPDEIGARGAVSVVWPQQDHLDPKVRAFIDEAVVYFAEWKSGDLMRHQ